MSNDTIFVTGTTPNHVGLYERHAAHPNGECYVTGDAVSEVALTPLVQQALNQDRIKRVDENEQAFGRLQKLEQATKDTVIGTKAWYRAQAAYQAELGNDKLALQLRGQGGYNPDVAPDAALDELYARLAPLEPTAHEYQHIVKQIVAREAEILAEGEANAKQTSTAAEQTESKPDDQTPKQEADSKSVEDTADTTDEEAKPKGKRGKA